MKKSWLIYLFLFFIPQLKAQTDLERPITVSFHATPLPQALFTLIDSAKVNLTYSNRIIPAEKLVTLKAEQTPLGVVLDHLLSGTSIKYQMSGSSIVLFKAVDPIKTKEKATISGYVSDASTGERITGAVLYNANRAVGTYTNDYGFYSLYLELGKVNLIVSYLGYQADTLDIEVTTNLELNVELKPALLQEIIVNAFADSVLLETNSLGILTLNDNQISRMASLGGEADIMRAAYTLPGIQTGADGFGGIAVRGGNIDQNMFMLDGVPVYNASHGVGIFSIYNSSAIRSAQLLKGNFPAQYGGRISSIWDIQTKEGNSNFFQGELELGLSSGKLTLEGPFDKGKGSVFVSGRRAFFDFYSIPITTRLRKNQDVDGYIGYYFFDLNFKINYQLSSRDRVYLSFYRGLDDFSDIYEQTRLFGDTLVFLADNENVNWGNDVGALRWTHQYSEKLFGHSTLTFSRYFYESQDYVDLKAISNNNRIVREVLVSKYNSDIADFSLKSDFDYSPFENHFFRFGGIFTKHRFQPGVILFDQATAIDTIVLDTLGEWIKVPLQTSELDAYVQDEISINRAVKANAGLRFSALILNQKVAHFSPQPRLFVKIFPDQKLSFNVSIAKVTQNLHLLSPTSIGLPKDLWVSATEKIRPQQSWQYALGFQQKIGQGLELSLEGYYKSMKNLLIFKGSLLDQVNSTNWQGMVSVGKGEAYGMEVLLKRQGSKFGGWIAYTMAWTNRQFDKEINRGNKFPFRLDRRHSLDIQALWKLSEKWEFAGGFKFATGSAFTFPAQDYDFVQAPGQTPSEILPRPRVIDQLNGERLPVYHKLDFTFNYSFFLRKARHTFKIGVYNVYNRKNPLYISIRDRFLEDGNIKKEVVQISLLPIFPSLRYLLEFR